jgi:hypothetical protein
MADEVSSGAGRSPPVHGALFGISCVIASCERGHGTGTPLQGSGGESPRGSKRDRLPGLERGGDNGGEVCEPNGASLPPACVLQRARGRASGAFDSIWVVGAVILAIPRFQGLKPPVSICSLAAYADSHLVGALRRLRGRKRPFPRGTRASPSRGRPASGAFDSIWVVVSVSRIPFSGVERD